DFVFAEDFFDDDADLFASDACDDHVEVAVERLKRGKVKLHVKANDFRDHVTHAREEFAADVFDVFGTQATDFLDDREGKCEDGRAAAHEERLRNDQRERNFYGEAAAASGLGADFDFAVERVDVGTDNVKTDAAAGEFRRGGGSGEAWAEEK